MGHVLDGGRQRGERVGSRAALGRDQQRAAVFAGECGKLGPEGRAKVRRKAEGCALASEQYGDARMGEAIHTRREALRRFGEARARKLCTAPNVVTTLGPSKLSWAGAATRSKS